MALRGMATVLGNLRKEMNEVKRDKSRKGMHQAVLLIRRESQKKVPVNTGKLKASHETEVFNEGRATVGEIRITAAYALYVHEAPMKLKGQPRSGRANKGFYWDPLGRATNKFLEKALHENQAKVLDILAKAGRIR